MRILRLTLVLIAVLFVPTTGSASPVGDAGDAQAEAVPQTAVTIPAPATPVDPPESKVAHFFKKTS